MTRFENLEKLCQKQLYSFLSSRYGIIIVFFSFIFIFHSLIQLLMVLFKPGVPYGFSICKSCSPINYADNIGGISFESGLIYPPIDVVYTWVNGSDPRHIQSRLQYGSTSNSAKLCNNPDSNHSITDDDYCEYILTHRFRDHNELLYSFRSLFRYAPWIRKVYLVTNGQIPSWLNLDHPKLEVITHEEIFPDPSHLPTFSSPSIESHLHHIKESTSSPISDYFLYFNDDVMLGNEIWPSDFLVTRNDRFSYSQPSSYPFSQKIFLAWNIPSCAEGCPDNWIGDGYCDRSCNNTLCNWDGGDCINVTYSSQSNYYWSSWSGDSNTDICHSGCPNYWLGDRMCDQNCNNYQCGFDMGDCGVENYHLLNSYSINSKETTIILPNNITSFYLSLPSFSIQSAWYEVDDDKDEIRLMIAHNKFHILTILLYEYIENNIQHFNNSEYYIATIFINVSDKENEEWKIKIYRKTLPMTSTIYNYLSNMYYDMEYDIDPNNDEFEEDQDQINLDEDPFNPGRKLLHYLPPLIEPTDNEDYLIKNYHSISSKYSLDTLPIINPPLNYSLLLPSHSHQIINPLNKNITIFETISSFEDSNTTLDDILSWVSNIKHKQLFLHSFHEYKQVLNHLEELIRSAFSLPLVPLTLGDFEYYMNKVLTSRRLLDTFADSLRHVNNLFSQKFGRDTTRKVPHHMPHMFNKNILQELQNTFSKEFEETSSHRYIILLNNSYYSFRESNDMQYAFSYFYFLSLRKKDFHWPRCFDDWDEDHNGFLDGYEWKKLVLRVKGFKTEVDQYTAKVLHDMNPESARSARELGYFTIESLSYSPLFLDDLTKYYFTQPYYHFEEAINYEDIYFYMVRSNATIIQHHLNEILAKKPKFICINDNIENQEEYDQISQKLAEFYQTFYPYPSPFELPHDQSNPFLYLNEMKYFKNDSLKQKTKYVGLTLIWILPIAILIFLLYRYTTVFFTWCQKYRKKLQKEKFNTHCIV